MYRLAVSDLDRLIQALVSDGFDVVGPTRGDGAIVYDRLKRVSDLPVGWTDVQSPGTYRLERRNDDALFGYVVGPHSYKKYFHPPTQTLFSAKKDKRGRLRILQPEDTAPPRALFGARACELTAIATQDRVLDDGEGADPTYHRRRSGAFVVAVSCNEPGGTCFCASMNTGPRPREGYDIRLTELIDDEAHRFLAEAGSDLGRARLEALSVPVADPADARRADELAEDAANAMGRQLATDGLKVLLENNPEHPRWDEVASRCLACGNCTMVCPTCFCTTVEDHTDLTTGETSHVREWDSCFTADFSYIHGGEIRSSVRGRYRQWMTHKLATWFDQFDTSGCVGCGRCITWCPVGIDITEEAAAIRG